MKAVRFHEYGGPEVLRYEEVEEPVPAAGEVRLRVAAAAVNPLDVDIRGGRRTEAFEIALPHVPCFDVAGTVDRLGDGVTDFAVGDEVIGFLPVVPDGAAAEYVVAPTAILSRAPTSISLVEAAPLPSLGIAAWQALLEAGELTAGQRVLINGASGGIGWYVVQLAKRVGADVIATAGPSGTERVASAGADEIVDYTEGPVTVTEPVDLLLNLATIPSEALAAMVPLVRDGGILVNTVPTLTTPDDESRGVRGVGFFAEDEAARLTSLVELIDRGELRVDTFESVPLKELRSVHERAEAGTLHGKVVVIP